MGFASAAAWTSPVCFRRGREIPWAKIRGSSKQERCLFLHYNCHKLKLITSCSIKLPSAEFFGDRDRAVTYLRRLSECLWMSFPEPVLEFPWKKAENMVIQQLLLLGEEASKWFFVGFFVAIFISDVLLSISRNRELMVPLGLFAGVAMGEFMRETAQEIIQRSNKNWSVERCLQMIGLFFFAIRFALFYSTIPGKMFLGHVCNGGIMQVLWLMKKLMEEKGHLKAEKSPMSGTDTKSTESELQ